MKRTPERLRLLLLLLIGLMPLLPAHTRQLPPEKPFIMILHSYHQGYAWTDSLDQAFRKGILAETDVDIVSEYMDTKRFDYGEIEGPWHDYLYSKYKLSNHKPALIISTDDDALNFLIKYREILFPGTPVVFCGVNNFSNEQVKAFGNCTGINELPDFKGTLDLALSLFPEAKTVIAITDSTSSGQANREWFLENISRGDYPQEILILDDWSEEDLYRELSEYPDAVIMLLHVNLISRKGRLYTTPETVNIIREGSDAPIFTSWEYVLGNGVVGGKMVSGVTQGQIVVQLITEILKGRKPSDLPVVQKSPNRYAFEYNELKRYKIAESELPEGSFVLGRPYSFYQTFRNIIWIISGIILALFSVLLFLVLYTILRRKANRDLEESRSRLELALKGGDLGFWDWSIPTGEMFFSDGYLSMIGYTREELAPHLDSWKNLIHPDDREKTLGALGLHITGKSDLFETEFRLRTKKGGWKWILSKGKVMETEAKTGKAIRACGTHLDITDRKFQELELTEKNNLLQSQYLQIKELNDRLVVVTRQAQEADQLKSAFLSNVSHEVRTPLNGIIGFSELLDDPDISDKEKGEYIAIIRSSGEHLLSLINDIILISKSDAGQIEIRNKEFNPLEILSELHDFFQANSLLREKKLDLVLDIPEHGFILRSDPDRIRQIISNLVTNAIKNTENGHIRIALKKEGFNTVFIVEDTGRGIPAEYREKIFERFYQITGPSASQVEGTGLGLSICKALADHLGGSIRLESTTGKGTTFYFTLPT